MKILSTVLWKTQKTSLIDLLSVNKKETLPSSRLCQTLLLVDQQSSLPQCSNHCLLLSKTPFSQLKITHLPLNHVQKNFSKEPIQSPTPFLTRAAWPQLQATLARTRWKNHLNLVTPKLHSTQFSLLILRIPKPLMHSPQRPLTLNVLLICKKDFNRRSRPARTHVERRQYSNLARHQVKPTKTKHDLNAVTSPSWWRWSA